MAAQFPSTAALLRYAPLHRFAMEQAFHNQCRDPSQSMQMSPVQGIPQQCPVHTYASSVCRPCLRLVQTELGQQHSIFQQLTISCPPITLSTKLHRIASSGMVFQSLKTQSLRVCALISGLRLSLWQVFVLAVGQARCAAVECLPDCKGASGKLSRQARLGAIHRRCYRHHQS